MCQTWELDDIKANVQGNPTNMEDKAIWLASSDGCFSIQSASNLWRTQHPKVQWAKLLWLKQSLSQPA